MAWKLSTELLPPLTGESFWQFVERGGDYFLLLVALWLPAPAAWPRRAGPPGDPPGGTKRGAGATGS
ncbi:MAG: hypothetical protein ACRD1K_14185 [Acidimicrobiales bacterium]